MDKFKQSAFTTHTHIEALCWRDFYPVLDCIKLIKTLLLLQVAAFAFFYFPFTIIRQGQNAIKKAIIWTNEPCYTENMTKLPSLNCWLAVVAQNVELSANAQRSKFNFFIMLNKVKKWWKMNSIGFWVWVFLSPDTSQTTTLTLWETKGPCPQGEHPVCTNEVQFNISP